MLLQCLLIRISDGGVSKRVISVPLSFEDTTNKRLIFVSVPMMCLNSELLS